jgi:gas vesicle structural protein
MTMSTMTQRRSGYLDRPSPSGLAEVVDLILDKGLVIDIYIRVALVGIELLTIDARIVIASVDTYLRFAEAVNRLDLTQNGPKGLPDLMGNLAESGARSKTRGALEGVKEKARETFGEDEDEDEDNGTSDGQPARRRRPRREGPE